MQRIGYSVSIAFVVGSLISLGGTGAASKPATGPLVQTPTPTPTPSPSQSPTPSPEPTVCCAVERGVSLALRGHLVARGAVSAREDICAEEVPVRIRRRSGDRWITVRKTMTTKTGSYRVALPDRTGRYRAVAPPVGRGIDSSCLRAVSEIRRHKH